MTTTEIGNVRKARKAIGDIRALLSQGPVEAIAANSLLEAALERFIERLRDGVRLIPSRWKRLHEAEVARSNIETIGDHIHHEYYEIDRGRLWSMCKDDLDPLDRCLEAILAANDVSRRT